MSAELLDGKAVAAAIRAEVQRDVEAEQQRTGLSPKLVAILASEAGARVGGTLYSDALSPPGGVADSYLRMFDNNVPQLKAAMLGM